MVDVLRRCCVCGLPFFYVFNALVITSRPRMSSCARLVWLRRRLSCGSFFLLPVSRSPCCRQGPARSKMAARQLLHRMPLCRIAQTHGGRRGMRPHGCDTAHPGTGAATPGPRRRLRLRGRGAASDLRQHQGISGPGIPCLPPSASRRPLPQSLLWPGLRPRRVAWQRCPWRRRSRGTAQSPPCTLPRRHGTTARRRVSGHKRGDGGQLQAPLSCARK